VAKKHKATTKYSSRTKLLKGRNIVGLFVLLLAIVSVLYLRNHLRIVDGQLKYIASTDVSVSFSSDESRVAISETAGSWNFVRPDAVKETWMQTVSNPYGGKIYWVSNAGSDSGNGDVSQPFQTITKAVNAASAGDIIYVQPGTYVEHVIMNKSGSADAPIILSAAPGNLGKVKVMLSPAILQATIPQPAQPNTGNNPGIIDFPSGVHDIWVNGLVIEGYKGMQYAPSEDHYSASGIAIAGSTLGLHITNNVVYNALHCGIKGGQSSVYEGNVVFDNGTTTTFLDHGMYINGSYDEVLGNIVFNNASYGLHIFEAMYPGDVNGQHLKVANNIAFGHRFAGLLVSVQDSEFYNNTSVMNKYGIAYFSATSSGTDINDIVKNNIFAFNNGANGFVDGSDNQTSTARNNINDFNDLYANSTYPVSFNYNSLFING
jgi:hypothetical protein